MRALVSIDPAVSFGHPTVRGTGIRTRTVYYRWLAGETWGDIAQDYGIDWVVVIAAVHYELGKSRSKDAREALQP
jgi:uncharacterized protein (DUF433 family)